MSAPTAAPPHWPYREHMSCADWYANATYTDHRVAASRDVGAGVTLSPAPVVKQVAR
jgi:hypothetical protein